MNDSMAGLAGLIGIYAALVLDIFSSLDSSPQTTQLFAKDRGPTLWKWVRIGAIVAVLFIALGVISARHEGNRWEGPLIGGLLALGLMYWAYTNAINSGGGEPGLTVINPNTYSG